MTNKTTPGGRTLLAIIAVIVGLFLMFIAPFITVNALNPALHRLVEVFQVQEPNGVWDTPVGILSATFHFWMALFVFAGATLVVIAKDIRAENNWARPLALALYAIPSVGGMTMVIPWLVLVMGDAMGNKNPSAGAPAALPIMLVGLAAYFITLLTEKAEPKTKLAQVVVFAALGIVGGMVWMNAQHGVRYFLGRSSAPFFEAGESNPELFLGGIVMYAAVSLFILAIGFLAARKEFGWYMGMVVAIVTFVAAFLAFLDRVAVNPVAAQEWMRGALLSAVLVVILVLPFFKKNLLHGK